MASYPATTKAFTTKVDGAPNVIYAVHVNDLQDEIVALENDLRGILPISRGGIGAYGALGTILIGGSPPTWSNSATLSGVFSVTGTIGSALNWGSGLGTIIQLKGPADQPFIIQPGSPQNLLLRDNANVNQLRISTGGAYVPVAFQVGGPAGALNYVANTTGWQVTFAGAADFRSIATVDITATGSVTTGISKPTYIYGNGATGAVARYELAGGALLLDNTYSLRIRDNAGTAVSALTLTSGNNLQLTSATIAGSAIQYNVNNVSGIHQFLTNNTEKFRITSAGDFVVPAYVAQTTGWQITQAGAADFRSIYTTAITSGKGFNGSFSYSAADPMVSMTIGNWAPRMSDLTSGYTLDYQDDAAFVDKWTVCTLTSGVGLSTGSLPLVFLDDSQSMGWNPATSPFPIVIEIDASGIGGAIPAQGNGYWNVGFTFRHTGNQNLVTNIKIESWDSGAYVTRYDQAPATPPISGAWLSPRIVGDTANGFAMTKCKITISGANPLSAGDTFRIQRLMLFHPTTGWDPWRLHRLGGTMYGQIKWGLTLSTIDHLLGPADQPFSLRAGAGQTLNLKDNAGTVRLQVLSTGVTVTGVLTSTSVAADGASLTNLNATNIATGTLADARHSANIPLINAATNTFTGTVAANLFSGSGASLTALNATNLATGTVADARLSTNAALKNINNNFVAQTVTTSVTSLDFYANGGYFKNNTAGLGLYNSANDRRFCSQTASIWAMQGDTASGSLRFFSDNALTALKGGLYWDTTNGLGLLSSDANLALSVLGGGNLQSYRNITQNISAYVWPGAVASTGLAAFQTSYYLASHGGYSGLYCNGGMGINGGVYVNGIYSWMIDASTYIICDIATRIKFQSSYSGGRIIYWDGTQFYPANDGGQNLGYSAGRWGSVYATVGTINTSDAREKKNIATTIHGSALLRRLRPVDYEWIDESRGTKRYQGLVAQEVAAVYPRLGCLDYGDDGEASGLNYAGFIAILIKGWQELDERVKRLEALH